MKGTDVDIKAIIFAMEIFKKDFSLRLWASEWKLYLQAAYTSDQ